MRCVIALLWVACAGVVQAQMVKLAWDASPSASVTGYRVHFGQESGSYSHTTNAGLNLIQTVQLPHGGRWFFAVTAYDSNGLHSVFSNEVEWSGTVSAPVVDGVPTIRLTPVMEASTNQVDWSAFAGSPTYVAATNAVEFYRLKELEIEPVIVIEEER